jgi:hypothetical protein
MTKWMLMQKKRMKYLDAVAVAAAAASPLAVPPSVGCYVYIYVCKYVNMPVCMCM